MRGYVGHAPDNDVGVITPSAALSSFAYAPEAAMAAFRHFYEDLGDWIWGRYGFVDGFSEQYEWRADSYLAISQGPIVVMIENYRSGLIWNLFMGIPEIQAGMKKLGFRARTSTARQHDRFGRLDRGRSALCRARNDARDLRNGHRQEPARLRSAGHSAAGLGARFARPAAYDPDPDYFFHWHRDSAIVIDALRVAFAEGWLESEAACPSFASSCVSTNP